MNKQKSYFTSEKLKAFQSDPFYQVLFVLRSLLQIFEEDKEYNTNGDVVRVRTELDYTYSKLTAMMTEGGLSPEGGDMNFLLDVVEMLSPEERMVIIKAQNVFLNFLVKAIQNQRGKKLEELKKVYGLVSATKSELIYYFADFDSDEPYYEALELIMASIEPFHAGSDNFESEEDRELQKNASVVIKQIEKAFESADRTKPFEENLFSLYDSLNEDGKKIFDMKIVGYGKDLFQKKLGELEKEYAGLGVDLTKHRWHLAAIKRIQRDIQKHANSSH